MSKGMKTWLITGASRGLGLEVARAVLHAGHNVIAGARNPSEIASSLSGFGHRLEVVTLDVTKPSQIETVVKFAIERFGAIDVLVNNAGYGQLGVFEEVSLDAIRKQFETNVFGAFEMTRAVLPHMRKMRSGHVVNISSIGGIVGYPYSSIYCASKFALTGWSEALSAELESFGVGVTVIHPGQFRTDFLDSSSMRGGDLKVSGYNQLSAERAHALEAVNHQQAGDPRLFGAAVLNIATLTVPPIRFAAGSDAIRTVLGKAESLRETTEAYRELTASTDIH